MSPTTLEELAQLVAPRLMRESFRHDVLTVGEILGATLRYIINNLGLKKVIIK